MLGPGTSQSAFISNYLNHRFPPPPAPKASKAKPKPAGIWGKTPQAAAPPPRDPSTSRNTVSEQDRRALEQQFGSGGKVYMKNRDEEIWGGGTGGGKKSKGGSGSVTPARAGGSGSVTPVPPAQAAPTSIVVRNTAPVPPQVSHVRPTPQAQPANKGKGKANGAATTAYDSIVDMSEGATRELLLVDRTIRDLTKTSSTPRSCFCQARLHPISSHTPSCPTCGLVLCTLNSPIAPCPSCQFHPLLPPSTISSLLSTLSLQRSTIMSLESSRVIAARELEERERAAIRFPGLGGEGRANGIVQNRGYAGVAGAGPGLEERIERGMEEGRSLHGRQFGKKEEEGKVLRLDMKTKKVKVQTKVKVVKKVEKGQEVELEEEEDGEVGWVDEKDDGVVDRRSEAKASGKIEAPPPDRSFLNITMDENERPVWTEKVEYVDEEEQGVAEEEIEVERKVVGAKVIGDKKPRSRKKKDKEVKPVASTEVSA
ncbi:hypothetical protein P7C70_g2110, partial [Phenoliferia sp. Uapishka_3]